MIDPVSAYIGQADLHRDNEVRAALAPLTAIAERTGATVLMLRHLRKSGGTNAIGRGLGSVAIMALARAGLMLLKDPTDPDARILAWPKMSVAPEPRSLRWRWGDQGGSPRIHWEGECDLSADEILSHQDREMREGGAERVGAVDAAGKWLSERLASGTPVAAATLLDEATAAGIKERTLKRARAALGARPEGGGSGRALGMDPVEEGGQRLPGR